MSGTKDWIQVRNRLHFSIVEMAPPKSYEDAMKVENEVQEGLRVLMFREADLNPENEKHNLLFKKVKDLASQYSRGYHCDPNTLWAHFSNFAELVR